MVKKQLKDIPTSPKMAFTFVKERQDMIEKEEKCMELIKTIEAQIADEKKGIDEYEKMSNRKDLTDMEKVVFIKLEQDERSHEWLLMNLLEFVKERCD